MKFIKKMIADARHNKMIRLYSNICKVSTKESFVIKTIEEENQCYIVRCMMLNGTYDNPEAFILRLIVVTYKGIIKDDINLTVVGVNDYANISDIKISENNVGKGFGSILMREALELIKKSKYTKVTGIISDVDWDHVDRLKAFYTKHEFDIQLDYDMKKGKIKKILI